MGLSQKSNALPQGEVLPPPAMRRGKCSNACGGSAEGALVLEALRRGMEEHRNGDEV